MSLREDVRQEQQIVDVLLIVAGRGRSRAVGCRPPLEQLILAGILRDMGLSVELCDGRFVSRVGDRAREKPAPRIVVIWGSAEARSLALNTIIMFKEQGYIVLAVGEDAVFQDELYLRTGADVVVFYSLDVPEVLEKFCLQAGDYSPAKYPPEQTWRTMTGLSILDQTASVERFGVWDCNPPMFHESLPAYDMVEMSRYLFSVNQSEQTIALPYHLSICDVTKVYQQMRYLAERVGVWRIEFIDDDLGRDIAQLKNLSELLGQIPCKISWSCKLRADYMDVDLATSLRLGGCSKVVLTSVLSKTNVKRLYSAIDALHGAQIRVQLKLQINETQPWAVYEDLIELIVDLKPSKLQILFNKPMTESFGKILRTFEILASFCVSRGQQHSFVDKTAIKAFGWTAKNWYHLEQKIFQLAKGF